MKQNVTQILARFITETTFEDMPEKVVQMAKRCFLDSLGCAIAGYNTNIGRIVADLMKQLGGTHESTIIGSGSKRSCVHAAFANAAMTNALDFDDTYVGHPGATVIPPTVAVGEAVNVPGEELITGAILGYEVLTRIGASIRYSPEKVNNIWGLGTWQIFGATATASKILHLDETQVLNAFGIAGCSAPLPSGAKAVWGSNGVTMVKNNYSVASEQGVMATLLAHRGFTGPIDILDGPNGFWKMCGSDSWQIHRMTENLGHEYEILNVSFKPYPACRWIHSAIDAVCQIADDNQIGLDDIKKVRIRTCTFLTRYPFSEYRPSNMLEAQFSLPYVTVVALSGKKPGLEWYGEEVLTNPDTMKLARKVELIGDRQADKAFPDPNNPNRVSATVEICANGKTYDKNVKIPKGDPQNPLTEDELREKFRNIVSPLIGSEKSLCIIKLIEKIEEAESISKITRLLSQNP